MSHAGRSCGVPPPGNPPLMEGLGGQQGGHDTCTFQSCPSRVTLSSAPLTRHRPSHGGRGSQPRGDRSHLCVLFRSVACRADGEQERAKVTWGTSTRPVGCPELHRIGGT